MSKNIYFVTAETIKQRTGLHFNVDEKLVFPEIKTAQDMHLQPALGSNLYNRLEQGIANNNLTADERTLLDDYITDALVYFVLSGLPYTLSVQFYNKGAIRKTDTDTSTLSMSELADVSNQYQNRAEFYRERLVRYLCANTTKYPQYTTTTLIDGMQPTKSGYRTSIVLDNHGRGCGLDDYNGGCGYGCSSGCKNKCY